MEPEKIVLEDRIEYRLNGELHREGEPAVIWKSGAEEWYLHGFLQREDGPAVIDKDGDKAWCLKGKCHREDGPAYIWDDGSEDWYIEGTKLTEEDTQVAIKILSGSYPFEDLPLLINHPTLKYFALKKLGS